MSVNPFYRFHRRLKFALPFQTWETLPRIPGYKNEYWDGKVQLTPRPNTLDVYLKLADWSGPADPETPVILRSHLVIRRLREEDWPLLPDPFHSAFATVPPLVSWGRFAAHRAARCIVEWTRRGRDGPLVPDACFVALTNEHPSRKPDQLEICGAAIVTLVPLARLSSPPEDCGTPDRNDPSKKVTPHLDWIFVNRRVQRHGAGTALLCAVVKALQEAGYAWLASTCAADHLASLAWHWGNGFVLRPGPWRDRGSDE